MFFKLAQFTSYRDIKAWLHRYERYVMPVMLVFGVLLDAFTFTNINITTSFLLLAAYAIVAVCAMTFQYFYDAGRVSANVKAFQYARLSSPLVIQFLFGALLSGSFIFYFFSGTVFVSWPLFAVFVVLMVSNDAFREYYLQPIVQMSVFFFILFSLVSIILPFALHSIGALIFLFSGIASVTIIFCYVAFLRWMIPRIRLNYRSFTSVIVVIFVFLNVLYFVNLIPPIPLVLRDSAVAHSIRRAGGWYELSVEKESLLDRIIPWQKIHLDFGGKVSVYSAIYAPQDLLTTIVHRWQRYDEFEREWVTTDRLSFSITGGVQRGYRGYSVKSSVQPGRWRVYVETERGQALGRVQFRVLESESFPELMTVLK